MIDQYGASISKACVLDIGSASIRLLMGHWSDSDIVIDFDDGRLTRLLSGVSDHRIIDIPTFSANIAAVRELFAQISNMKPRHGRCVGTFALRNASNANQFLEEVSRITGYESEIITPDREGYLAWKGSSDLLDQSSLLIDLGGGSTELIFYDSHNTLQVESLPIGSGNTISALLDQSDVAPSGTSEDVVRIVRKKILQMGRIDQIKRHFRRFVIIGGTATSSAFLLSRASQFKRGCVHGREVPLSAFRTLFKGLWNTPKEDRARLPGIESGRGLLLPVGLAILLALGDILSVETLIISEHGLRFGLLRELMSR